MAAHRAAAPEAVVELVEADAAEAATVVRVAALRVRRLRRAVRVAELLAVATVRVEAAVEREVVAVVAEEPRLRLNPIVWERLATCRSSRRTIHTGTGWICAIPRRPICW